MDGLFAYVAADKHARYQCKWCESNVSTAVRTPSQERRIPCGKWYRVPPHLLLQVVERMAEDSQLDSYQLIQEVVAKQPIDLQLSVPYCDRELAAV